MTPKLRIVGFAIFSRLFIVSLQIVFNWLIPDHKAGVFVSPVEEAIENTTSKCHLLIDTVLGGFRRWDAEYFLHIAEHGYTYENTLAFYPLYPFTVRYMTYLTNAIVPIETYCLFRDKVLLMAILLNVFFFVEASLSLYALTNAIFSNRRLAKTATMLFCLNPASIFFTAPYTESLFCWLSFSVMLYCVQKRFVTAMLPLVLSMWCRSNGMVNFGFILFYVAQRVFKSKLNVTILLKSGIKVICCGVVAGLAFGLVQIYNYLLYCTDYDFQMNESIRKYGIENNLRMAGKLSDQSPWCSLQLPISYSYIQLHYWNVGFLNYYELKQVPNFLLAAPILTVLIFDSVWYLVKNPKIVLTLGLSKAKGPEMVANRFVYVVHALALSIFCLLFVHIQVSTRMLASSSPCLYWFCARHFHRENHVDLSDIKALFGSKSKIARLIFCWFFGYLTIGTVLFCNFLPWT